MRYCPSCRALRETLALQERGESEERCSVCGFQFQDAAHPEPPAPAQGLPAQGLKVLCIDDDRFIRQFLTDTLRAHGFVPLTAPDGPSGIAAATAEHPQLILVDIMMPGMDGFEVCRCLRADPRTAAIPLVILTARADPKLNIQAFKAGADLALTKPVEPDKLMATLRAALSLKKGRPPSKGPGSG
jgi:DNA-binding response OmpR family regulator